MLPWPGDSEGTFQSSNQTVTYPPVCHTYRGSFTQSFITLNVKQGRCKPFFCSWYDSIGNRTRVYRFISKRSLHSITDQFTLGIPIFVVEIIRSESFRVNSLKYLKSWFCAVLFSVGKVAGFHKFNHQKNNIKTLIQGVNKNKIQDQKS